jgi:HEAT repeat protein
MICLSAWTPLLQSGTLGRRPHRALTNQHRGVRFNSAYSLGLLGPLAKDAVPALKDALNDSDPEVRTKALESLQKIEPVISKSAK